jgi:type IV pilus assembly protein PilA
MEQAMIWQQKGFTLIELMIVITIMAILMSIAIPSYQQYTKKAHYAEVIQAAAPYKLAVAECYQDTGTLNQCNSGHFGIPKPYKGTHLIDTIKVSNHGQIHITPKNIFGIQAKEDLILTPELAGLSLIWHTTGGAVSAGYIHDE